MSPTTPAKVITKIAIDVNLNIVNNDDSWIEDERHKVSTYQSITRLKVLKIVITSINSQGRRSITRMKATGFIIHEPSNQRALC